jgi:hypothetical protein
MVLVKTSFSHRLLCALDVGCMRIKGTDPMALHCWQRGTALLAAWYCIAFPLIKTGMAHDPAMGMLLHCEICSRDVGQF